MENWVAGGRSSLGTSVPVLATTSLVLSNSNPFGERGWHWRLRLCGEATTCRRQPLRGRTWRELRCGRRRRDDNHGCRRVRPRCRGVHWRRGHDRCWDNHHRRWRCRWRILNWRLRCRWLSRSRRTAWRRGHSHSGSCPRRRSVFRHSR
jgi:hypothetical protein